MAKKSSLAQRKAAAATVAAALQAYADRRIMRGYSAHLKQHKPAFRVRWHRDQTFEFIIHDRNQTITVRPVLPNVPANSEMNREFRRFLDSFHGEQVVVHRRIDVEKCKIKSVNKSSSISLIVSVLDGDYDYAIRRVVHIMQEIYLGFLPDGPYRDYMAETFNLEPDFV